MEQLSQDQVVVGAGDLGNNHDLYSTLGNTKGN